MIAQSPPGKFTSLEIQNNQSRSSSRVHAEHILLVKKNQIEDLLSKCFLSNQVRRTTTKASTMNTLGKQQGFDCLNLVFVW